MKILKINIFIVIIILYLIVINNQCFLSKLKIPNEQKNITSKRIIIRRLLNNLDGLVCKDHEECMNIVKDLTKSLCKTNNYLLELLSCILNDEFLFEGLKPFI